MFAVRYLRATRSALCGIPVALLLAGCRGPSSATPPADPDLLRIEIAGAPGELRNDPASIDSATIVGNVLSLHVTHGGGCRTHVFGLHTSGVFLESEPVQVPVQLSHNADNDMCRALVRPVLRFDLTELREMYRKSYGRNGTMVLQVKAPGEGGAITSVPYEIR